MFDGSEKGKMNYFYLDRNGNPIGPTDTQGLKQAEIAPETYVWFEGLPGWVQAGTVPELSDLFRGQTTPPVPAEPSATEVPPFPSAVPPSVPVKRTPLHPLLIGLSAGLTVILVLLSPIFTAFIASIFDSDPTVLISPVAILFGVLCVVFLLVRRRKYFLPFLLIYAPILLSFLAGSVYYGTIKRCWTGYENGTMEIVSHGKHGIVNRFGFTRIKPLYDRIYKEQSYGTTYYRVQRFGKWGLLSEENAEILPCAYDQLEKWGEGYYKLTKNDLEGLAERDGSIVLACIYDQIEEWDEKYFKLTQDGLQGLADRGGNVLTPCKYVYIWPFEAGVAKVNVDGTDEGKSIKGGTWGYIDTEGDEVIRCVYSSLGNFDEDDDRSTVEGRLGDFVYTFDRRGNVLHTAYTGYSLF